MKLTKEQRDELVQKLEFPWASVNLVCDGDKIALRVVQGKGLKFYVFTYVNGWFRGAWMQAEKPVREQRYLRKIVRSVLSPTKRARLEKDCGKRWVKKQFGDNKYTYYRGDWPSGKAVIAHLCKVCESVEVDQNPESGLSIDKSLEHAEA